MPFSLLAAAHVVEQGLAAVAPGEVARQLTWAEEPVQLEGSREVRADHLGRDGQEMYASCAT
jgi:hypothetical protein